MYAPVEAHLRSCSQTESHTDAHTHTHTHTYTKAGRQARHDHWVVFSAISHAQIRTCRLRAFLSVSGHCIGQKYTYVHT
jgi:hypothetical protein